MDITTAQNNYRRVQVASNGTSYVNSEAILTKTEPTTVSLSSSALLFNGNSASVSGQNPSLLFVMPFIVSAAGTNTGMGMRVIGWRKLYDTTDAAFWYVPTVLADFTLGWTSGTIPSYNIEGAANTRTLSSIVQVAGTPNANVYSPATAAAANVEPAYAMLDLSGSQIVTAQFKASGAPNMGCFWSTL